MTYSVSFCSRVCRSVPIIFETASVKTSEGKWRFSLEFSLETTDEVISPVRYDYANGTVAKFRNSTEFSEMI